MLVAFCCNGGECAVVVEVMIAVAMAPAWEVVAVVAVVADGTPSNDESSGRLVVVIVVAKSIGLLIRFFIR